MILRRLAAAFRIYATPLLDILQQERARGCLERIQVDLRDRITEPRRRRELWTQAASYGNSAIAYPHQVQRRLLP
jgi:hypothetical protein